MSATMLETRANINVLTVWRTPPEWIIYVRDTANAIAVRRAVLAATQGGLRGNPVSSELIA